MTVVSLSAATSLATSLWACMESEDCGSPTARSISAKVTQYEEAVAE